MDYYDQLKNQVACDQRVIDEAKSTVIDAEILTPEEMDATAAALERAQSFNFGTKPVCDGCNWLDEFCKCEN
jgi:hypothetical protein